MHYYKAHKVDGHEMAFQVGCALSCIRHIQNPPTLSKVFLSDASIKSLFPDIFAEFAPERMRGQAIRHFSRAVRIVHERTHEDGRNKEALNQAFVTVARQVGWQASFEDFTHGAVVNCNKNPEELLKAATGVDAVHEWADNHKGNIIPDMLNRVIADLPIIAQPMPQKLGPFAVF